MVADMILILAQKLRRRRYRITQLNVCERAALDALIIVLAAVVLGKKDKKNVYQKACWCEYGILWWRREYSYRHYLKVLCTDVSQ
jgi:hypothetical protein